MVCAETIAGGWYKSFSDYLIYSHFTITERSASFLLQDCSVRCTLYTWPCYRRQEIVFVSDRLLCEKMEFKLNALREGLLMAQM